MKCWSCAAGMSGGLGVCCGCSDVEPWWSGGLEARCRRGDMEVWMHGALEACRRRGIDCWRHAVSV